MGLSLRDVHPVCRLQIDGCSGKAMEGVVIIAADLVLLLWSTSWEPNAKVTPVFNALLKLDDDFMKSKATRLR